MATTFFYPPTRIDTTGLATSAKQDEQTVILTSIDNGTPQSLGQKTMANSMPVAIASDQSAVPISAASLPLPTGAATETTLASRASETTLASRASETTVTAINNKLNTLGQKTSAASVPVTIASDQTALPVSAASLPLPTGAATETTLSALNTKTPALGQTTMAASQPVTLASDQTALPVTMSSVVSTANSTTANLAGGAVFTGTSENVQNYAVILVNIFSSHVSAALGLSIQQSSDGTNWDITDAYTIPAATGKTFSVAPAARFLRVVYTNGATLTTSFRLQTIFHYQATKPSAHSLADTITNHNDGEITIAQMRGSDGTNAVPVLVDAGGRQFINMAQINAVTPLMGNGVTGTGSLRVTLASDTSSNTNAFLVQNARAPTSTLTNVTSSATNVTLLALNTNRKMATIYNDSSALLYIKWGATASATSHTVQVQAGGYYELPGPTVYTGVIDGIWASAAGFARVTELV